MNFYEKKVLGRTGLNISRLGLAGGFGVPASAVERAFHEFGINYFFWSSPRKRGMREGLRNLVKSHRDDLIIVMQSYDHIGLTLGWSITKGMKTLGIDYVDVALLGWHNWHPPRKLIHDSLRLIDNGMVRHTAMSGHNRKLFGEIARQPDSPIDIFMARYNAAHRGAEDDIFPYLGGEHGPGMTTFTATCWRKLLNRKKMPPGEQPLTASDCYRFVLSNPHVDLCLTGPSSEQEMAEGFSALDKGPLSQEEMVRIRMIGDFVHG